MRYELLPCFGRSRKTGKRVGFRHRWFGGWGNGYCEWCGRTLEQLKFIDKDKAK